MNANINIIVVNKTNYEYYKDFIKDCVTYSLNSSFRYTNFPNTFDTSDFFNWLQVNTLYIFCKENRMLGFSVFPVVELNDEFLLNVCMFIHPRVCKMAYLNLLSLSCIFAYLLSKHFLYNSINLYLYYNALLFKVQEVFQTSINFIKITEMISFVNINVNTLQNDLDFNHVLSNSDLQLLNSVITNV